MQTIEQAEQVVSRPCLDPQDFQRAFPFHVHVDAQLRMLGIGAGLAKALGRSARGASLDDHFTWRRPRERLDPVALRQYTGLVVIVTRTQPALTLRGSVVPMEDGSLVFVVAPVLGRMEDIAALHLGFNDFAPHDPQGEVLLISRAAQMTLEDAHRLADRLRVKTAQLDTIMELSANGVAYLNPLLEIEYANSALARMLAQDRGELIGRSLSEIDARLDQCMGANATSRGVLMNLLHAHPLPLEPISLQLERPEMRVLQLSVRANPAGGCVLYFRDITVESEVDRMKSEFLSTAAHELRTPMASVFGFSELLLRREFEPERRQEMVATIHRQAGLLINLVNELLDLARIEARRGKDFKRRLQPVGPIVEDAVAALLMPGDQREIHLDLHGGDAHVMADAEKLGQAVTNVLSNAYKYSPQGGDIAVRVHMQARPGAAEAGEAAVQEAVIEVEDRGIGMTPDQLGRVFERFYRADPSGTIPGTGLGMSLVKEIMELHGGRVEVASVHGQGTTVRLRLPVPIDTAEGQGA